MALTEDMSVFFNQDEHAVAASWTPSGGGATQTASVIFDESDEAMSLDNFEAQVGVKHIVYPSTDLVGLAEGGHITVDGTVYIVRGTPKKIDDGKLTRAALGSFDA